MSKAKSIKVDGVEFALPFKMKKKRFTQIFGSRFGERTEQVFESLIKAK